MCIKFVSEDPCYPYYLLLHNRLPNSTTIFLEGGILKFFAERST